MMTDLSKLADMSNALKFPKNMPIIKEGANEPYSMYIILQGQVRIVKNYGDIDQMVVATLGAGDYFGEMSLFLKKPRTATVITSAETVVLEITENNVYEVIETNPNLLYGMIAGLCKRVDFLNDKVLPQHRL